MDELTVKKDDVSLSYAQDFLKYTKLELDDIKRKFFKIGFRLNEAVEMGYVERLGYADIYELAEAQFEFGRTTTKNLMEINRVYSDRTMDRYGHYRLYSMQIDPRFEKYTQTQLVEMLPLADWQRAHVPTDFKTSELRDYKKIVHYSFEGGDVIGASGNKVIAENPRHFVEEYRKKKAEGAFNEVKKIESIKSDVAPGQLNFNEYTEEIEEYHQTGGNEIIGQSTDQSDAPEEIICKPRSPRKKKLKNNKEREKFICDETNYTEWVLSNNEIGLTVTRMDLANGAKIYRTSYFEYVTYLKETVERVKYHLVTNGEELPQATACCNDYSCKGYTLEGTSITFIVAYLTKYKDEI